MLRKVIILLLVAGVIGGIAFWVITAPQSVPESALPPYKPDLANGRTMFFVGGCASCHAAPKSDDKMRLSGGRELKSPFGTFHVPNISPDPKDGIGTWSEANFITAMVKGTSPDGRHYYPAFPYSSYQHMSYGDLRDLLAFLKTLPPVSGKVRDHDMSFPFHIRRLTGGWKFLFLDGKPFQTDPGQSAEWNRGAYLVNGPAHCAECHSPRNFLGGIIGSKRFAGGASVEDDGWVPNITQKSLGDWSEKDIAYMLKSGAKPDGDAVGSSMGDVVENTAQLSDADRAAMAVYIKSLPPIADPPKPGKK
jgi:mono/diheme cytochrome c family protein